VGFFLSFTLTTLTFDHLDRFGFDHYVLARQHSGRVVGVFLSFTLTTLTFDHFDRFGFDHYVLARQHSDGSWVPLCLPLYSPDVSD
jgi:hypothetical protein